MAIYNRTGYIVYPTLIKVSDDVDEFPLDVNNNKTVDSGLAQDSKDNDIGDPDYIAPVYDDETCPLDGDITITEYRIYSYADVGLGQNRGDACAGTYPIPPESPQTVYAASDDPLTVTQFFNAVVGDTLVGEWTNIPTAGDIVAFSTAAAPSVKYTGYVDASGNITSIVTC